MQEKDQGSRKQAKLSHGTSPGGSAAPQNPHQATEHMNAISMLAPLPAQPVYNQPQLSNYGQPAAGSLSHDRWENMVTLFEAVRGHARGFEYPMASVAALESILIRLYLESPVSSQSAPVFPSVVHQNSDPNIQPNLGETSSASGQEDG